MQTVPQPLRRKPVQKAADSRYVSLFSDASNKSDITISDGHKGLLPKSTKLYEVGIDNLTLSMNGLSMLTPSATEPIILEILALRTYLGQAPNDGAIQWPVFPAVFRLGTQVAGFGAARDYQLLDSDVFTTLAQFMDRLHAIAQRISAAINAGFVPGDDWEFNTVNSISRSRCTTRAGCTYKGPERSGRTSSSTFQTRTTGPSYLARTSMQTLLRSKGYFP